jgi:hypothetical protein
MSLRKVVPFVSLAIVTFSTTGSASQERWGKMMEAETYAYQHCEFSRAEEDLKKAAGAAMEFQLDDPRVEKTLNAAGDLY